MSVPGASEGVSGPASAWPARMWLVRHGESEGNVARDRAEAAGLPSLDLVLRDMDVPLSETGRSQGEALGRWFGQQPPEARPTVVLVSPYVRAVETAELIRSHAGLDAGPAEVLVDERLREREFGILDGLTHAGIAARHPEQAAARALLGKFWHRPPGGESWADVALRLRSLLDTAGREMAGEQVLVVSHQVVILVFRYLLERLSEQDVLAIDRQGDLGNCSITRFDLDPGKGTRGGLVLRSYNDVTPLLGSAEPLTAEPDRPLGRRG